MPTFIRIRWSPAKAAINSDRAIAEKLTGASLPCQESSALRWPAQSNYRLKVEDVLKLQNNVRFAPEADSCTAAKCGFPRKRTLENAKMCCRSHLADEACLRWDHR